MFSDPPPQANVLTTVAAHNQSTPSGAEWYPDSGSSHHVTNSVDHLDAAQPYAGLDQVMVGNGEFLPITHVGSASIPTQSGKIPLSDVLICPDITKSLLSVSKLTDDFPCEFTFDSTTVCVKDKATSRVLSKGKKVKGLYRLDVPQFLTFYSFRQQVASDGVWHKRLGHPNDQVLKHLSTIKAILFNKTSQSKCESCQLGKTCRLPFFSSDFRSSRPLERIHCDVWGPAPVVSTQGFRFYVVFIDNYSTFCWLYPLKMKSDVFTIFKAFQSQVENQYKQKISVFQSDGGGEFVNKNLSDHFTAAGIRHFISCPHTPEQNGIAERRHRHITELGLSMIYQSHLPLNLWVEAFFTSAFLSNLLPTTVNNKMVSPFERLNGSPPIYTALRVFGCAYYPYLRPYANNKFDPKSLLSVFVGYNEKYKGYRCYHPPTGRVFINRHVLFDEERMPYKDTYQHLLPSPSTTLTTAWSLQHKTIDSAREDIMNQWVDEDIGISVPLSTHQPNSPGASQQYQQGTNTAQTRQMHHSLHWILSFKKWINQWATLMA